MTILVERPAGWLYEGACSGQEGALSEAGSTVRTTDEMGDRVAGGNFRDRADEPALLYVIRHEGLAALKVGVVGAASREVRLRAHARQGWVTEMVTEFETGRQALQAERAVLGFLRECGATDRLPQREMPQGGYTETVAHADLVDLDGDLLQAIAQAAGRIIRRAHSPLHQWTRDYLAAGEAALDLIDEGHKALARKRLQTLLELGEEMVRHLGPREPQEAPASV
ncbi:hypothetical protein RI578_41615 (plasmid) [Streptomyces sp. BB1-1-1]|uniref:hypothetical protein n=1 Tax=Streptomyces sp. BB1-1-1 TaxID=3074430 RepID=UPI0028773174|nr:hypothetical protein [Streptomyces sp. BB1-1-1]WND40790.1 hypothetical protein RI578_41615 [Streptomyces sp. BB1-1-1]